MYEHFYGLKARPFSIVPNPDYLYLSPRHQQALTYLEYGLMEGVGFIVLTGEIGTGKTTLVRHLLKNIESDVLPAVVFNTNVSSGDLLRLVLQSHGLGSDKGGKAAALDVLYKFLIQKYGENKRVLLIIDEAQALPDEAMDELRMLSNLQSDEQLLLQIMLVGQPELREKLKKPLLFPFAQRVAGTYHLSPLAEEETLAYIAHRLEKAGRNDGLFEPEALALIYQASQGFPRSINLLCDAALVYGFGYELKTIGMPVIEQVIRDKGGLGLDMVAHVPDRPLPAQTPEGGTTQDLLRRLETLEQTVRALHAETAWRSEEMDQRVERAENRMVIHLKERLDAEQAKGERLLMKYSMLVERYKAIKANKGEPDLTQNLLGHEPAATPSEPGRMKYSMTMGRYKAIKGNRVKPEKMKKDFDIESITSVSEHAHRPKHNLLSWLKGGRSEDEA